MSIREEFVVRALEPGANLSELCREYGVSRKTAYKWKGRYEESGLVALEDMSRRPSKSPIQTTADVVAEVVSIRLSHPEWGPKKIAVMIDRVFKDGAPSVRTIARILERSGLVQRARRRRREAPRIAPLKLSPKRSNELWTVDFKGWWLSVNGDRCEPLTIRDAYSRFVLAIDVMRSNHQKTVVDAFRRVFKKYGLPRCILVDNGTPWIQPTSSVGLTKLSAWWLSLGIEVLRTRPGTPSDNGGHERMHRDMAAELEAYKSMTRQAQQDACDRWRHEFNHVRPHESLQMRTPAQVYQRSAVAYDDKPAVQVYPDGFLVRRVSNCGQVRHARTYVFVSAAVGGYDVGLEVLGELQYAVWFAHRKLGTVDFREERPRLRVEPWNTGALPSQRKPKRRSNSKVEGAMLSPSTPPPGLRKGKGVLPAKRHPR